ncbi:cytochrome c3 family protein [Geminicoccaceae bacterium 1502E]|nr:cytochrome c3 family protein [Geminicoccaceae bacterium 1502E]
MAAVAEAPLLRSQFSHADHRRTPCAQCHHNFTDDTGSLSCFNCHKQETRSESTRIDVVFHDFCTGCHRQTRAEGKKSGPVIGCSSCHNEEAAKGFRAF